MQQKMRQTAEVMAPSHADNSNTVGWSNATTAEGYHQLRLLNRKTVQPSCSNATILGTVAQPKSNHTGNCIFNTCRRKSLALTADSALWKSLK
jgi:hypothetical protein